MNRLTILRHPDARLRTKASPLDPVALADPSFQGFLDDMFTTMYASAGIGLAATQVNVHHRVLVMDISPTQDQPWILINPTLVAKQGVRSFMEGCLSVPGAAEEVRRADRVEVSFLDRQGTQHSVAFDGLLATCVQHEMDHLDGVLFLDRISSLRRSRALARSARQHS